MYDPLKEKAFGLLWSPIEELGDEDKYDTNLLLCAPELVDEDCNPHGIGMGYFQDERDVPSGPHGAIREPESDDDYRIRIRDKYIHGSCSPTLETISGAGLDAIGNQFGAERGTKNYDGWRAWWSMSNDEWMEVPCTPTHFIRMTGPLR